MVDVILNIVFVAAAVADYAVFLVNNINLRGGKEYNNFNWNVSMHFLVLDDNIGENAVSFCEYLILNSILSKVCRMESLLKSKFLPWVWKVKLYINHIGSMIKNFFPIPKSIKFIYIMNNLYSSAEVYIFLYIM